MSNGSDGSLSQEDIDTLLESQEDTVKQPAGFQETPQEQTQASTEEQTKLKQFLQKNSEDTIFKNQTPSSDLNYENMNLILNVKMGLSVEIGKTKMKIEDILHLGSGSIVELDKLNGELVDILVNNRLIAKGQVIAVDENFGVKVVHIIDPKDRLKLEI